VERFLTSRNNFFCPFHERSPLIWITVNKTYTGTAKQNMEAMTRDRRSLTGRRRYAQYKESQERNSVVNNRSLEAEGGLGGTLERRVAPYVAQRKNGTIYGCVKEQRFGGIDFGQEVRNINT
jgi:hypothetical protein